MSSYRLKQAVELAVTGGAFERVFAGEPMRGSGPPGRLTPLPCADRRSPGWASERRRLRGDGMVEHLDRVFAARGVAAFAESKTQQCSAPELERTVLERSHLRVEHEGSVGGFPHRHGWQPGGNKHLLTARTHGNARAAILRLFQEQAHGVAE